MSDLYPTPTRIQLLRDIEERPGKVYTCIDFDDGKQRSYWRKLDGSERAVTAICRGMQRAGWIEEDVPHGLSFYSRRDWLLTDKGREILAGAS